MWRSPCEPRPSICAPFILAAYELLHGGDHLGIAKHFDRVRLVAEDEVDREHAGFRLRGRGVGGRQEHEVDITALHLLQGLRFGAELRAGILIDRQRALAQFRQLLTEHLGADAVAAGLRLVIGERELAVLRERRRRQTRNGRQQQGGNQSA